MLAGLWALAALFILLPGFLSARIVQAMSVRSERSELERIIEALLFSFVTYILYVSWWGTAIPLTWTVTADGAGGQHYSFAIDESKVFFLVGIALVLGIVWGIIQGRGLVAKMLIRLRLTQRSSRESVWKDVLLNQKKGYVQVGLVDGRNVIGIISSYSDSGEERSLFLTDAAWLDQDFHAIPVPGSGLLLTGKAEIQYVMFLGK